MLLHRLEIFGAIINHLPIATALKIIATQSNSGNSYQQKQPKPIFAITPNNCNENQH
jgi:hypothetical protein